MHKTSMEDRPGAWNSHRMAKPVSSTATTVGRLAVAEGANLAEGEPVAAAGVSTSRTESAMWLAIAAGVG